MSNDEVIRELSNDELIRIRKITIREAFAKAGFPAPEGKLVYNHRSSSETISDGWVVLARDRRDSQVFTSVSLSGNTYYGWDVDKCWVSKDRCLGLDLDLSNLPAIDAFVVLPCVIQKVVK